MILYFFTTTATPNPVESQLPPKVERPTAAPVIEKLPKKTRPDSPMPGNRRTTHDNPHRSITKKEL